MPKFSYVDRGGNVKDGDISLDDYRLAADDNMSLSQRLNFRYPDADVENHGTAFQQGQQSCGIYTKPAPEYGIMQASTVKDVLNGTVMQRRMAGEGLSGQGGIIAPSDQGDTPSSRLFFVETVLQILNEVLQGDDYALSQRIWDSMVRSRVSIPTAMYTQPMINIEAPKAEDSAPIAQNSLPKTLVSITASEYSRRIQTNSVGLQISDEAVASTTLDLVGIIFSQQAAGEALRTMWTDIANVLAGNVDQGESALPVVGFKATYDSAAGAGEVTQKGWLKYLWVPDNSTMVDSIICNLDTYLAIQNRTGRPVIYDPNTGGSNTGNLGTYGLNVEPNLLNISIGVPNVMIVPDSVVGANTILGFDSRYALRRVTNASASYSATEKMILQRSNFFRIDWGRVTSRLFDSAFRVTSIANV